VLVLDRLESASCFVKRLTQYSCAHHDCLPVRRSREAQENSAVLLLGRGKQTVVLPQLCDAEIGFFGTDHDDRDGREGIDGNHILSYELAMTDEGRQPAYARNATSPASPSHDYVEFDFLRADGSAHAEDV
jgi:hypothetical protein